MAIRSSGLAVTFLITLALTLIISSSVLVANANNLSFWNFYKDLDIHLASSVHSLSSTQQDIIHADFGNQFNLKLNQSAIINSGEVQVTFLEVTEDSRCPSDLNCFWAGQIEVSVNILENGHDLGFLRLVNNESRKDLAIKRISKYLIEFMKAEPFPKRNQHIELSDYIISLTVYLANDD